MRILWISCNGGNYEHDMIKGTGGWIGALQHELLKFENVKLGIIFPHPTDNITVKYGRMTYLPIRTGVSRNRFLRVLMHAIGLSSDHIDVFARKVKEKVNEYRPDVVHIWGIEAPHVAVIPMMDCPFVVHIQGLTSFCLNNYCAPFFSLEDLKRCNPWFERVLLKHGEWEKYKDFQLRGARELHYASYVRNWIGRTDWDYLASQMLSPGSNYFHCDEIIRYDFNGFKWHYHHKDVLYLQSNISCDWYKGVDVVLKTAKILKGKNVNFRWNIYGITGREKMVRYISHKLRISPIEVNVEFNGFVDAKVIRDSLLYSDVYVHPSYIENSSNAIAEAMALGLPTIAQYVGGNPSMFRGNSGVLVAANEPYILASKIMMMKNEKIANDYSKRALRVSSERQNNFRICQDLLKIYEEVRLNK